jgi:hypothetical protein
MESSGSTCFSTEDRLTLLNSNGHLDSDFDKDVHKDSNSNMDMVNREVEMVAKTSSMNSKQIAKVSIEVAEAVQATETSRCMIDPERSPILMQWDLAIAFMLIVVMFLAPFETAFLEPAYDAMFVINRCIDAMFLIDLVLQFFTLRRDGNKLLSRHVDVAAHYMKGWFWIDAVSIFPFDVVMLAAETKDGGSSILSSFRAAKVIRLIRFLRLIRLLRLSKFAVIMARWQASLGLSYAWLSIIKFVMLIMVISHWMACVWGGMAMQAQMAEEHEDEAAKGSVENNWLDAMNSGHLRKTPLKVYNLSLYWAVMTLTSIGYGDITPVAAHEYTVCTICMMLMAGLWAYIIGAVCSVVATMHPHELSFRSNMDSLNEFMDDYNMTHDMRRKMRNYFYESKDIMRQRVERDTIEQLSSHLQGQVLYFLHIPWISKIWYFRGLMDNDAFITETSRSLEVKLYAPSEGVTQERTLFIVRRGICIRLSTRAYNINLPKPPASSYSQLAGSDRVGFYERRWPVVHIFDTFWGEDFFLYSDLLRDSAYALALTYLELVLFDITALIDLLHDFPDVKVLFIVARAKLALARALSKVAPVLAYLRNKRKMKTGAPADLKDISVTKTIKDVLSDSWVDPDEEYNPLDPKTSMGSMTFSGSKHWMGTDYARKKAQVFKHATFHAPLRSQPVVGRLDMLSERVEDLDSKQEAIDSKLDTVLSSLDDLTSSVSELSLQRQRNPTSATRS